MSDKQRRQIDFIDEIYNKVVLKKEETTQPIDIKPSPVTYSMPYKQPYNHHTVSDDKENNSPFGNLITEDLHIP